MEKTDTKNISSNKVPIGRMEDSSNYFTRLHISETGNMIYEKQDTQQLETGHGCEETQKEFIRSDSESVVANGAELAWEKETKLTLPRVTTLK
ncbi:hypothetical protein TNCV_1928141 [Trichonephila clavipes]|nr:hypothetical protein TNCV_1928141 [Trichonephila clavipes]